MRLTTRFARRTGAGSTGRSAPPRPAPTSAAAPAIVAALFIAGLLVAGVAAAFADDLPAGIPPMGMRPLPPQVAARFMAPAPPARAYPESLDWRDAGVITPPRNQLHCGGCWAFAAIGCIEAMAILAGAPPDLDLSEQFPLSCDTAPNLEYGGIRNDGCCGGTVTVFEFLRYNPAIAEMYYAFGDGDFDGEGPRNCSADPDWNTIPCPSHLPPNAGWRVQSWHLLPAPYPGVTTKSDLMAAIQSGPVWLGYEVYDDFIPYWLHGDPAVAYKHTTGSSQGWHAVLLIGYDYPKNAWIVKNSWGATSGPFGDGTFMIDYDAHNCSFGMNASIITGVDGGEVVTHACCIGEQCLVLTAADCTAQGGDWLVDQTGCDPNPCPTPVTPTSFGRLKSLFR
jgi:hypothetical protein